MQAYWLFVRQNFWLLLFGFACVFWGNFGQSFFLGWYGNAIQAELGISAQTYGALYSLATLCSAATVVWAGALIDRWPLLTYVCVVAAGLFAACVVMALTQSIWMLALGFYGLRLFGQALLPHTGTTTMARSFDADRGKAMSLAGSSVPVGEILLPILAVALINHFGWRSGWWPIALTIPFLFVPLIMRCLSLSRAQLGDVAVKGSTVPLTGGRALVLKDGRFWLAMPTLLATPFVLTALFIHQGFLLSQKGWSEAWMAKAFVLYGVMHWVAQMLYGLLVDRFSGLFWFRFFILPLIAALLLVANLQGAWVAMVMMMLLATTIGASSTVVNAMWAEVYGTRYLGAIRSVLSSIVVFSTALSPFMVGFAIDQGLSLRSIANVMALVLALGLILLRWSYPARPGFSATDAPGS